jgi:hypothetical protein
MQLRVNKAALSVIEEQDLECRRASNPKVRPIRLAEAQLHTAVVIGRILFTR